MAKPKKQYSLCTIKRTMTVSHGTINMATGEHTTERTEVVTKACETPLFADKERSSGVCRSCRVGWDVEGNRFANENEKKRALKGI